jgi:hypothetical protein
VFLWLTSTIRNYFGLGIERHGVGNWKTIADAYFANKSTRQVEEHYWEHYMGVHGYCLPAQVMWKEQVLETAAFCPEIKDGSRTSAEEAGKITPAADDLYRTAVTHGYTRGEPVRRDEGFQGLGTAKSTNKDKQDLKDRLAQLPGSDLPGFTPLRGDFDVEYEVSDTWNMVSYVLFVTM